MSIPLPARDCEFLLVRHGQTTINKTGQLGGLNAQLTPHGIAQVESLGRYLARHRVRPTRIFSSPLVRACNTARILCRYLDLNPLYIALDHRLKEQWRGDWEGQKREDVYTPEIVTEMAELGMAHRPPNGQTMNEVADLMVDWLGETVTEMPLIESFCPTYLVSGHGTAFKGLLQKLFGIDPLLAWKLQIDNASLTKISFRHDECVWRLDSLNVVPDASV